MVRIIAARLIDASVPLVFRTVADPQQFSQALPHIARIEFLSQVKSGVGTRFRETRVMQGREVTTELEVKEYVDNDRIRLVADSHGTVWDTLFTVKAGRGSADLTMTMDATAYRLLPKLLNPLIRGMVQKAVEKDMDAVKPYCEQKEGAKKVESRAR